MPRTYTDVGHHLALLLHPFNTMRTLPHVPSSQLQHFVRHQPNYSGLWQKLHTASSLPLPSSDFCFFSVITNFRTPLTPLVADSAMHRSPICTDLTRIFQRLHPSHNTQPAVIPSYHDCFLRCTCHHHNAFPSLVSFNNQSNHMPATPSPATP